MFTVHTFENRFSTRDGIELRYRVWSPAHPKTMVILIHGAGEHIDIYKHLGHLFCEHDFAFITFDLRGFGCSGGKCGHVRGFEEYIHDLDQLIHYFRRKFGEIRCYLIGHSLGGLIVTRYIQEYAAPVDRIVLSAPALYLRLQIPYMARWFIRFISFSFPGFSINPYNLMKVAHWIPRLRSIATYDVRNKLSDPFIALRYSFRWLQELLNHKQMAYQSAEKVKIPTLCICGDNPTEELRRFMDRVSVEEKQCVFLPDAGHNLLHPEKSSTVIQTLMQWFTPDAGTNHGSIRFPDT
ncbi:alpha/beta fold hydrolase [Kroppenstedtia eburnea]|uniref:alpha/beta fold hydrolase n=1 Tax=Kroppenstedtia eburnea TaxID=714067 RepID=UPI00363B1337